MNKEFPKEMKITQGGEKACARMRLLLKRAQDTIERALRDDANACMSGDNPYRFLSAAVFVLREMMRPKVGTLAFLTEITNYYCKHEPRLRLMPENEKPDEAPQADQKKPEVFRTPKEVVDFVTANPPLGEVKDAPTPIDPSAPEMVNGGGMRPKTDEDHMSRPEAAHILCRMATSRNVDVDGVVALQMGVKTLLKRHFDTQRNRAKRRARAANAGEKEGC